MSSEFAEYEVEENQRLEKRRLREAWEEARGQQRRRRLLQQRLDELLRQENGQAVAFEPPPAEPREGCGRSELETYVENLRDHCAVTERQVSRIERDQRREQKAWQRARERAQNLEDRASGLQARVEEAARRHGSEVLTALPSPPVQPTQPCERTAFEEYVRNLRAFCVTAEQQVARDEAVAERRREDAWKQVEVLGRRWGSLRKRLRVTDTIDRGDRRVPERPADSCSLSEIETYVEEMQAHCDAIDDQVHRSNVDAVQRALRQDFRTAAGAEGASLADVIRRHAGGTGDSAMSREGAAPDPEEAATQEVLSILDDLSPAVPADESARLERVADEFVAAGIARQEGSAAALARRLRSGVWAANDRAAQRARDAQAAGGLRRELRGLQGDDVAEVVARIGKVERGEASLTPDVASAVEQVAASARARADRAYVAEVMRDEMEKLGYRAEEGFESLLVRSGKALVRKDAAGEYGVEISLVDGESTNEMHMEPVRIGVLHAAARSGRQDRDRDRAAEDACCDALVKVRNGMNTRGISSSVLGRERRTRSGGSLRVVAGAEPEPVRARPGTEHDRRRRQAPARQQRSHS